MSIVALRCNAGDLRRSDIMKSKLCCAIFVAVCLASSMAWADSLELKNGSLIKGKLVGAT